MLYTDILERGRVRGRVSEGGRSGAPLRVRGRVSEGGREWGASFVTVEPRVVSRPFKGGVYSFLSLQSQ